MNNNEASVVVETRDPELHEKLIIDIIKKYYVGFFYSKINETINKYGISVIINKEKFEMVGHADVTKKDGTILKYEIRFRRITNLVDKYAIVINGL